MKKNFDKRVKFPPIWRSDGAEQLELEKMMKAGIIENDKPIDVQNKYADVFGKFSPSVFRTHFSMTKRNLGKMKELNTPEIPEIGGGSGSSNGTQKEKPMFNFDETVATSHAFQKPPILCDVYRDYNTKIEKCIVVVSMFAGASNFIFEIGEDGQSLKIFYEWPKSVYNIDEIFKSVSEVNVPNYHPKYLALENALENVKSSVDEKPCGTVEVKLPIPVQNLSSSWYKKLIESNGCTIVYLELSGFQTKYAVKKEEKCIQ